MRIKKLLKNPYRLFSFFAYKGLFSSLSDERYIRFQYRSLVGTWPNLKEPKSFNEKLQWLKLYDRRSEYTVMVDKLKVRDYIEQKIGKEYLIPLLGAWEDPEKIDFNSLPDRFVLKCNHNSGKGIYICKDKSTLDREQAKKIVKAGLEEDYYLQSREWPYKHVPRRVIAEQFIGDGTSDLPDYKFLCFNGKVKCSFICSDRFSDKGLHVTFFDRDWNVMPFERHYPAVKEGLPKPKNYEKMIQLAEQLSQGIPFVRVDFYEVEDKIYFGELTFYPGSGYEEFTPVEWDYRLGEWIDLPKEKSLGD